jgi:large subunit ribosomal protein L3
MTVQGIIAKKIGMTRIVGQDGLMIPVTLLKIEHQKVTKLLTVERDGYSAIQVGYYEKPEHRLTKPDVSRLRKSQVSENFTRFIEFRTAGEAAGELGTVLTAEALKDLKSVDVTGITKGRGFEGAITRWGHATGRKTHGSDFYRKPGSLGTRTTPGRVFKNRGQPGQYGNVQRTTQNLKVVDVDIEKNLVAVKGSVPGCSDGYIVIKPSVKSK